MRKTGEHNIRVALVIAIGAWVVVSAFVPHLPVNPASRYAAIEALVDHGTWAIDDTSLVRATVDKVHWDGHFYSSKPPLLPLLLTPFYGVWRFVTGIGFADDAYATAAWMRLWSGVMPWLIGCFACGALLDRFARHSLTRIVAWVAWVAGSLPTAYAAHLDNHTWAVAALLLAALALAPALDDNVEACRPLAGGLSLGFAFTFDLGAGPIAGLVGLVFIVWRVRANDVARAMSFSLAALAPVAAQAMIQWQITGSLLPFYLLDGAYDYPGSYWNRMIEFDALDEPRLVYAFHALIGHHGLFSVTPWLAPAGIGLLAAVRGTTGIRRAMAAAACAAIAFTVGYYVVKTNNYGGRCVGMRWFMVLHPVLWIGLVFGLERHAAWRRTIPLGGIAALVAISAVSVLHGVMHPFEEGLVHGLYRAIGMGSVDG